MWHLITIVGPIVGLVAFTVDKVGGGSWVRVSCPPPRQEDTNDIDELDLHLRIESISEFYFLVRIGRTRIYQSVWKSLGGGQKGIFSHLKRALGEYLAGLPQTKDNVCDTVVHSCTYLLHDDFILDIDIQMYN